MPHSYPKAAFGRPMLIAAVLIPLGAGLTGCGGDSSSSSGPQVYNGTFVDSPVAGLDYRGEVDIGAEAVANDGLGEALKDE